MNEDEIDWNKSSIINMDKKYLFIIMIILFLVCGLAIGFKLGEYSMHNTWNDFYEEYKEKVEETCVFIEPQTNDRLTFPEFNITNI